MVRFRLACISMLLLAFFPALISAGPYAPAADEEGTTAVYKDDPAFGSWASGVESYNPGLNVDIGWQDTTKSLGMATGSVYDIVSLGEGGDITLTFDEPIQNRYGWDFAVFENGMNDTFLELAYVEVSSDGITDHFARFKVYSLTQSAVVSYGALDPTNIDGFAGKYRAGYGTPFDFEELANDPLVKGGQVDLNDINYIRIVDVVGDGDELDDSEPGNPIYDPYPTTGSAGFDLDAIGILISDPTVPWDLKDGTTAAGGCFIATAAYGSPMEPEVQILRDFRDTCLLTNRVGRAFVKIYYRLSPEASGFIAERKAIRYAVRILLLPFVGASYAMIVISTAQKWVVLSLFFVPLVFGLIAVIKLTGIGFKKAGKLKN